MVKKGDSIWQIASQHNTTAKEIQTFNRLKGPGLHTGQVLLIAPSQAACAVAQTKNYTVKGGETPFMIAKKHDMELGDFSEDQQSHSPQHDLSRPDSPRESELAFLSGGRRSSVRTGEGVVLYKLKDFFKTGHGVVGLRVSRNHE